METLVNRLGYASSARFYSPDRADELPPGELSFGLRTAQRVCGKMAPAAHVEGLYVLQRDVKAETAVTPVVYLIRAESDHVARRLHQFVWNQNIAPFLIVESPQHVRIYSGFRFDSTNDDQSLDSVARDSADLLERLADFRADAIDDAKLWSSQWAKSVDPAQRVDRRLLADLEKLDQVLQKSERLTPRASHGLIGRYVYLRYLRDREILSDKKLRDRWGIDPDDVFSRRATLKAFREVNDRLQAWLNGSVFSLGDDEMQRLTAAQLKKVAGVFVGDSPVDDGTIQPSLFDKYDFSQIPIETLSCVYEQFLHGETPSDKSGTSRDSRGKALGAYYTPLPLAEFVLTEMDRHRPLEPGMTVLDPACGSGVFLVQSYRRLIERQRRKAKRELKATELRDLLTDHVFGVDRDADACRVAELSLILTLLDYVDPPDLESTTFKLPYLRDRNILEGDFFDKSGCVADLLGRRKFAWVVGNPPWSEAKKKPTEGHEHYPAYAWMQEHKATHPTSGNQLAEAFVWKSAEHLTPDGICGLVVPAMTWFKSEATLFRRKLFAEYHVWCVANFANLAYRLFAGRSQRPASVVFFSGEPPDDRSALVSYAPFVMDQVTNAPDLSVRQTATWTITIGEEQVREVALAAARQGEALTWKIAMWGTSRDSKLLRRVASRFSNELIGSLQDSGVLVGPYQGLETRRNDRNPSEAVEHCPELLGRQKLEIGKLRGADCLFAFPDDALSRIGADECFVRKGRAKLPLAICRPPHIIVDASRRFAVYMDEFFVVPPLQVGIACSVELSHMLKALSLLLSSDLAAYHQFFLSPQWGIDANRASLAALRQMPAPVSRLTPSDLREWSQLHEQLVHESKRRASGAGLDDGSGRRLDSLIEELNRRVFSLLELREQERWLVSDFVRLNLQVNKGKHPKLVTEAPSSRELATYLQALRDCLDEYLSGNGRRRHRIEVLADGKSALIAVALAASSTPIKPRILGADDATSHDLRRIRDRLVNEHSQWVYFDRGLKIYSDGVLYQFKPLEWLRWTRRQAVIDADEIIATALTGGDDDE